VKQPSKNGKIIHMNRIIGYFYIFSKLTTSLVLMLIISFMGYALIKSYQSKKNDSDKLEIEYSSLKESIDDNDNKFIILNNQTKEIKKQVAEIKKLLKNSKFPENYSENEDNITNLIDLQKQLESKINKIELKLNNLEIKNSINKNPNLNNQITPIIDLIVLKYKNGEEIDGELLYLESIAPVNKLYIFEKLNVIKLNKFYGLLDLSNEFNRSVNAYVNFKFTSTQKKSILSFLLKFVSIKPNNLSKYENEELNLLMNVKKMIDKEDINSASKLILKLDNHDKFFIKWKNQSNIYMDFISLLEKVS
tara:strand:- start:4125 stop:5042 length:918 start_codon:yes stop_codon:yes gene_type:complete